VAIFQEIRLTLSYSTTEQTRTTSRFARVMPLAFITYGLAYLDRVNHASAEKGLSSSLNLSPQMGPVVLSSFFIGYCLFQIPGAMYAAHRSVKWLVFWALILWGGLSGLTGVIRNVPLLITDRILLGAVEAATSWSAASASPWSDGTKRVHRLPARPAQRVHQSV